MTKKIALEPRQPAYANDADAAAAVKDTGILAQLNQFKVELTALLLTFFSIAAFSGKPTAAAQGSERNGAEQQVTRP